MDIRKLVSRVGELLKEHLEADDSTIEVKALGNRIHIYVDDDEFVLVAHTTLPEKRWMKNTEL